MTVSFLWPVPSCYHLPEKLGKLNVQGQKGEGHRGERIGSDGQYGPTGHHGNLGFKLLSPGPGAPPGWVCEPSYFSR